MKFSAAVITVSDKGSKGERIDTSGPAIKSMLEADDWDVIYDVIVPDERADIQRELLHCADDLGIALVITTGGTGFSPRDITPEATMEIIERATPGIPELMRAESMKITPRACLSRAAAGIRKETLIVNLPGSEKAARENLSAALSSLKHGIEMLRSAGSADCGPQTAIIRAVCISDYKGIQKHPVDQVHLLAEHGIEGDAHAGTWHRQVSLLGKESVDKLQQNLDIELTPGIFAENILTEGICLYQLPIGTKLRIGTAIGEVTQIGKECHKGCAIREKAGDCVMPREGIFVRILEEGFAKAGDTVMVLK